MKPLVAVVGRPNVGKSTFFNRVAGKRIAIVEDTPGVTRDRIYADAEWAGRAFALVDTGGIEPNDAEPIFKQMREQAELAIDTADGILFLVDGREGLQAADHEVADMLRRTKKPVIVVVNKVDNIEREDALYDFYELGMGNPIAVSAEHGMGTGDLLDEVVKHFPPAEEEETNAVRVCVAGKPNVGKPSIVNALLGSSRTIVSDVSGTTRDAIDTPFRAYGQDYVLIDTAGIRRKRAVEDETIERYSVIRAFGAIRRCDVALLVIDATVGVTEQDTKIAGYIINEGRALVIVVNKWDLIEKETGTLEAMRRSIQKTLQFASFAPILFISAKTGQRMHKVMEAVQEAYANASGRITTGVLNDLISEAVAVNEPPSDHGRRLKIYYASQVAIRPPTFVFFVNDPELMHFSYLRYLENSLRKALMLTGTPIRLLVRQKSGQSG